MGFKKKLQTGNIIEAWTFDTGIYKGISVGAFDKMCGNSKSMVSVESVDSADGVINRIVINKAKAEKYGFRIIIDETEENRKDNYELSKKVFDCLSDGYDDEEQREDTIDALAKELSICDNKFIKAAFVELCKSIEELMEE